MTALAALLAEYDRQCLARAVFDRNGRWLRDRSLPTREATDAVEDALAVAAAPLGITATELRRRIAADRREASA